ncbi:hypothetical protein ACL83_24105 [Salmonella enterica subsp. enterica serovar Saintpaul]|nr:hypothetical protein [Salmonella enterica subsp. enterica serovar Saintpaul]
MAHRDEPDPSSTVPEEDRLEQEEPADPSVRDEQIWPDDVGQQADEADRLEQAISIGSDADEEYTPDVP